MKPAPLPRLQPTATDCPRCHNYLARTDDGAHCDVCEVGWDDDGVPAAYEEENNHAS